MNPRLRTSLQAAFLLLIVLTGWAAPLWGQIGGGGGGVSQTYVDNAITNLNNSLTTNINNVAAAVPTPFTSIPPGPLLTGVAASNNQFVPSGAAQRQGVMRTNIN